MRIFFILIFLAPFQIFSSEMSRVNIDYENQTRYFLIHEPKNLTAVKAVNLVIGIHGYTGTASGFEKETTGGFNESAVEYGLIAAFPP